MENFIINLACIFSKLELKIALMKYLLKYAIKFFFYLFIYSNEMLLCNNKYCLLVIYRKD